MNKKEIISKLKSLGLDSSQYWVVAGSAMVMHGLRGHTSDIDLGCSKALADTLESQGYQSIILSDGTRRFSLFENIEIFEDWLFDKVIILDEIPVISLTGLLQMKKSLKREKDKNDISLLETALNHTSAL